MPTAVLPMYADGLMIGLALFLAGGTGRASDETTRDVLRTVEVRKLLADDPELAPYNIGVSVHGRVATLWGPVPSIEVAFRAELTVRGMFELTNVRNELFVSELVEPIIRQDPKLHRKPLPDAPPALLPRPLTAAPGLLTASEGKRPILNPLPRLPKIESPPPHVPADLELAAAVRGILSDNPAFRDLQFIVKDGHVYLRTLGSDFDALDRAAQAVERLPNVISVSLVKSAN